MTMTEPALVTAHATQHHTHEKPDVARARQSKCTKPSNDDNDLIPLLYRPPPDEDDPYSLVNDMPAEFMVKHRRWTPYKLQSMILQVLEAQILDATTFHHSASIVNNAITIPSVPLYAFNIIQYLFEMDLYAPKWKLEFKNTSVSRGRFTITVPTSIHKAFQSFTRNIEKQMLGSSFLPREYNGRDTVWQSGRADIRTSSHCLTPDGSISAFGPRNRFLILEVAHAQREKDFLRKAQTYLLHTNERIKIVVVVIVDKKTIPRSQIANRDKLCAETDTVHVHVCKFIQKPDCVTGEYVVKRLQIFPGPMPEDTFEIAWSDINAGSWKKAKVGMGLPNDTPQPVCRINFHELYETARWLSGYVEPEPWGSPAMWDSGEEDLKGVDYLPPEF